MDSKKIEELKHDRIQYRHDIFHEELKQAKLNTQIKQQSLNTMKAAYKEQYPRQQTTLIQDIQELLDRNTILQNEILNEQLKVLKEYKQDWDYRHK